jgi:hypothetical protein
MGYINKGQATHKSFKNSRLKTQVLIDQQEQTLQLTIVKEEP